MDGQLLQTIGLAGRGGGTVEELVSVSPPPRTLSPDEAAVIQDAASFDAVDYVFFRRFSDDRSSQPAAFVIDNSDERFSTDDLAHIHNALWLHGVAPLVYVAWPTRVDILSCARGADFWRRDEHVYSPVEHIEVAAQVDSALSRRHRFSAMRLADGTFWDDPRNHTLANREKTAHESLIQTIVETDQALDGESNPQLRRLLLLMVLIKYLEDRNVFSRPAWFSHYHKGARCFFDVLKGGEPDSVLRLLRTLEDKFNGDVFALPAGTRLTKKALKKFATLVEARTVDRQRYLWAPFSFAHLPVEVISHLYQRFVQGSTAVYTPPFLAALLLDYAMPYERLTGKERVLDPACGSGVFLVGAFRRLVNVWRSRHRSSTFDVDTLKSIIREQIYGVELDKNAVDLSAFSLALAVCDCLQPNVIWNELRFDRLRDENLLEADFFDCAPTDDDVARRPIGKFDVIVGNPPFQSAFSESAQEVNAARVKKRGTIPDKQIAYLFLDRAMQFMKPKGHLCLIQPSGFLYNLQSHSFRTFVAQSRRVQSILDFTSIRGLFGGAGADPKTIAILVGHESDSPIVHLTFRRTYEATQHIGFELDHYDRNRLHVDDVAANPRAARANLLGGGRLGALASRLGGMRSLSQFVDEMGWLMGEGFIEGKGGKPAKHLTDQPLLPTGALTVDGINVERLETVVASSFYRSGRESLFQPPLVLIRENESLPIAYWDRSNLAYKHEIVGIHAPLHQASQLEQFHLQILNNLQTLRFASLINGSRGIVQRATSLLKSDIEALPFPEDETELRFAFWESALADDTLNYFTEFVRRGQNSALLRRTADSEVLTDYSALFCRMLGSVYSNLRASEPVFLDGLICQPFYFGDEPTIEWLGPDCEEPLTNLVFDDSLDSLRTIRVIRFYHENVVFVVKPDRLRYWIRSTAIRDADDTLIDLQKQGY